jgi:hypothetical protein
MNFKRLTLCAVMALTAVFPAAAMAGAGPGDDIAEAIFPPGGTLPLSTASDPNILGYTVDTSAYGTQDGEPTNCPVSRTSLGKTVWGGFRAPQFGRLDVTAAGFDAVIMLIDVNANRLVNCTDRLAGRIESFPRDSLPTVKKGRTYAVQVGGAVQPDGSVPGGGLEVDLELIRPEITTGDATMSWVGTRGGVKIRSLSINAPRGASVVVGCVRKSCGRTRAYNAKSVLREKISDAGFLQRLAVKPADAPAELSYAKTSPQAAGRRPNFNGKRIKNGDTFLVAIQREDEIGVIFVWRVKNGVAGTKTVGCIEPNSTRIKRLGTCRGR